MQRDPSRHLKISGNKIRSPTSLLTATASSTRNVIILFLFFTLLVGALITARWNTNASMISTSTTSSTLSQISKPHKEVAKSKPPPPLALMPCTCTPTDPNATYICPSPPSQTTGPLSPSPFCPDYFRWIHEDLRPWKNSGITRELVERARETANFRLVVLNGRAYFEKYQEAFQTRDVFTLWGILQLLRRYPGQVPDLDIMFDCVDWPVIGAEDYLGKDKPSPPPLFRYCGNDSTLDIVFPDWSFWGWPEINIKPWEALQGELKEGNKRVKWLDREPYAYWKGNPAVAETRMELVKCNVSEGQDWNARIYTQDWLSETKTGFKQSDLASQCIHRYKIYIEGSAWSVSEKYILACNSLSLLVTPHYYDFFTRSLMPVRHYWPIREDDKCRSIKFAVDWGNSHKQKAQAMGNAASTFIQEDLKMDYVYDYMFHLLSEYAKLLKYKPTRPPEAIELCSESMACPAEGTKREFMMESMVKAPHGSQPCSMPPPYSSAQLEQLLKRKAQSIKQVEMWEQRASQSKSN